MADEEEIAGADDDDEGSPQSGKKKLLIVVVLIVLLGGGAAGAYFMGMLDGMLGKEGEHIEASAEAGGDENAVEEICDDDGKNCKPAGEANISYLELPDILVNLSTSTNQSSFLKMKVTLEVPSEKDLALAQEKLPVLQDHFNTYLRDLRATDLSGSAGMYRLREELLARANKSVSPGKVSNILFREILVQ